ncbi:MULTISPECIES: hypothetical protein [unclassified Streptomyces]|uniref:hypothetical protein n=1 Tax=unclassified Streptomyces TaxID=2593676 RepID=UPI002E2A68DA|nr:hypothetical protein [Streptomyces sp. NBC_00272]
MQHPTEIGENPPDPSRTAGAAIVRAHLQGESESWFAGDRNSVEGVTYATLAADDWYCGGPSAFGTPAG